MNTTAALTPGTAFTMRDRSYVVREIVSTDPGATLRVHSVSSRKVVDAYAYVSDGILFARIGSFFGQVFLAETVAAPAALPLRDDEVGCESCGEAVHMDSFSIAEHARKCFR